MTQFFNHFQNPLLIKELRQFVRNKFIIILINIYVVAIVVACMLVLTAGAVGTEEVRGKNLFFILVDIVSVAGVFTIVVRTAWSTANEKINEDLMLFSAIKPSTIVFGKIISGVVFTLLLMSITMPFVTLAYILRGIDLEVVFVVMIESFIVTQMLNSFAIFIASSNKMKFSPILSTFIVLAGSFLVYYFVVSELYIQIIIDGRLNSKSLCEAFYPLFCLPSTLITFFICGSIAMFSPLASNRIFPLRVSLTVVFFIVILLVLSECFFGLAKDAFFRVEMCCLIFMPFIIAMVTCERDQWSTRIRRSLPKSLVCRIFLFPFYTGAACGLVWIFIIVFVLFAIDIKLGISSAFTHYHVFFGTDGRIKIFFTVGICIFTFNYCVTAMLIRSAFFKKWDSKYVIFIALILLLIFTFGSMLLYILIAIFINNPNTIMPRNPFRNYSESLFSALNPFSDFDKQYFESMRASGMILWFFVLLLPLHKWYAKRLGTFNPNVEESITYDEARKIVDSECEIQNAKL
ncbi:MAG: hypothetical protein LBT09_05625 [Planctomycetaceae bacterium]|jgi:hypothetical protein|nr:hypothetical protein [Planctomycetaceae bacterium]